MFISPLVGRYIGRWVGPSVRRSVNQLVIRLVSWLVGWLVVVLHWLVGWRVGPFVVWVVGGAVWRLVDWWIVSTFMVGWLVCWLVGWLIGWLVDLFADAVDTRRGRRENLEDVVVVPCSPPVVRATSPASSTSLGPYFVGTTMFSVIL